MKRATMSLAVATLVLAGCVTDGRAGGTIVTDGTHATSGGSVIDGHVVLVGGRLEVDRGASVAGSAFVTGGELALDGRVEGDISVLGGRLEIGPAASVGGDLRIAGGEIFRDPMARIEGVTITGIDAQAAIGIVQPDEPTLTEQLIRFAVQAVLLLILAAVAARMLPRPMLRIGEAAARRTALAVAIGLLVVLVGLPLLVFMAFTIVLLPLALLLVLISGIVLAYAWTSIGLQVGRRLPTPGGRGSTPVRQAVTGTLLLTSVAAILGLLPWVGDALVIAVLLAAVGAAALTRLGAVDPPTRAPA